MKICSNTKVRVPTVNICMKNGSVPNIIPSDPSSANFTSDGYIIGTSAYILTFILDSNVGYFDSFSAVFTPTSGYDPSKVFLPCTIVTNPRGSGLDNYLMYLVLNGSLASGQTKTESFTCRVSYVPYTGSGTPGPLQSMNGGEINNDPP